VSLVRIIMLSLLALVLGEGGVEAAESASAPLRVGFSCGWAESWQAVVEEARRDGPLDFRRAVMARVGLVALPALGLGVGLVLMLAWRRPRRTPNPSPAPAPPPLGLWRWLRVLSDVVRAGLGRLSRSLELWRLGAKARAELDEAIDDAREADRQLRAALEALRELPSGEARVTDLASRLDAFRAELLAWAASLPLDPLPETAPLAAELAARLARDVRVALLRAVVRGVAPDWRALQAELDARLPLPGPAPLTPLPRARWVPRAALASLVLMGLGAVLLAAWFAAGAAPLLFAGLFALSGLGLMSAARLAARHAAGGPLFSPPVEQPARWLTRLTAAATALALASSAMDAESGLDLGDPPPVALPDSEALRRPELACPHGLCAPLAEAPPP
jgi:hypothetical protein